MEDQFKQLLASNNPDYITIAILQLPNFDVNIEPLLEHAYNLIIGCYENMEGSSLRVGNFRTYIRLEKGTISCSVRVVVNDTNILNKIFLTDQFGRLSIEEVFKNLKKC
jgi:hypothetical protein